jgi:hypothetical protein
MSRAPIIATLAMSESTRYTVPCDATLIYRTPTGASTHGCERHTVSIRVLGKKTAERAARNAPRER